MDFLDYREKLGIGCYDGEKFTFFLTKIFNFLNGISEETHSGCVTSSEYFSFCNLTGSRCNPRLSAGCQNRERFNESIPDSERRSQASADPAGLVERPHNGSVVLPSYVAEHCISAAPHPMPHHPCP